MRTVILLQAAYSRALDSSLRTLDHTHQWAADDTTGDAPGQASLPMASPGMRIVGHLLLGSPIQRSLSTPGVRMPTHRPDHRHQQQDRRAPPTRKPPWTSALYTTAAPRLRTST
jgi:hypothetical protein